MPGRKYSVHFNQSKLGAGGTAEFFPNADTWVSPSANLGDAGVILTTTPLGADASYTQDSQDRLAPTMEGDVFAFPVGSVRGLVWADQAGTLYLEQSDDDAVWETVASVAVSANTTTELDWSSLSKRWYRFRYVNGGVAQGSFVLIQQVSGLAVIKTNTKLTGSSLQDSQAIPTSKKQADVLANDETGTVTVLAGAVKGLNDYVDSRKYSKITAQIQWDAAISHKLYITRRSSGQTMTYDDDTVDVTQQKTMKEFIIKNAESRIFVKNNDASDHTIKYDVLGWY